MLKPAPGARAPKAARGFGLVREAGWRNVLRDEVAINVRANEIDEIVSAVEGVTLDPLGCANRRQLRDYVRSFADEAHNGYQVSD